LIAIVLNYFASSGVTRDNVIRRVVICEATCNYDYVEGILVIGRFDDEHGSFEVFCEISRVITLYNISWILFEAFRIGESNFLSIDEFK
jgi:hypothetical protein